MLTKKELLKGIEEFKELITNRYEGGKNGNGIEIIKNSSAHEGYFFRTSINIKKDILLARYEGLRKFVESF